MNIIHCLFSIDNNYDQPENNLVCWWPEKPSLAEVLKALQFRPLEELDDASVLFAVSLWKGDRLQHGVGGVQYRIEKIMAGEPLG